MASTGFLGRTWGKLTGGIAAFAIGTAASDALEPIVRPLKYEAESRFQNQLRTPDALASMVVQGILDEGAAAGEAASWGINADRFSTMVRLAGNPPGPETMLELWRRGEIDQARVEQAIREGRTKTKYVPDILALRRVLLSPDMLAAAVAEGHLGEDEGAAEAAKSGISRDDFGLLVKRAHNAPGPGQILELVNRGKLTEAEGRQALTRTGLAPEYHEDFLALRTVLPSPSDVVRFAVREVFTPDLVRKFGMDQDFPTAAVAVARMIGLDEETLRLYWAAHWDLPSPEQGFRMYHRRIIDKATLEQLLRALDVMPYWRGKVIDLAYNVPGRIDLRRMYEHGIKNRQEVYEGYLDLGYSPADAQTLTEFAVALKTKPEKDLTKAEVAAAYQAGEIDRDEAAGMLKALGYEDEEAGIILDLADVRRKRAYRTAVTNVVRGRFKARQITDIEASNWLDQIGLPPNERDQLLDLWRFEVEESPARLTLAQLQKALKNALITEEQFKARLAGAGYTPEDVAIIYALST